jgi:cytochrome c5
MSVRNITSPRIATLFLFVLSLAAPVLGQATEGAGALPEGPAKGLVASTCSRCHALSVVTSRQKSTSEWGSTVDDMISRGAQITSDETKSIVQYLAQHFSPGSQTQAAVADNDAGKAFPDLPGKEVLMNKCFHCHNEAMWKTLRQDKRGWESSIYPMVGRGALWTEEEISTMAEYLAKAFGPNTAEKPQPKETKK